MFQRARPAKSMLLNKIELGEYCRKKGIYPEQINSWREACEQANDRDKAQNKKLKKQQQEDRQRFKSLERELIRKERALAETAALLVLQKKPGRFGGGQRGHMSSAPDRRQSVKLINVAQKALKVELINNTINEVV